MPPSVFDQLALASLLEQLPKGWALKKRADYYGTWMVLDSRGRIFCKGDRWANTPAEKVLARAMSRLIQVGIEASA